MPHDESFDMPFPRYGPQSSFVAPVVPPSVDPDGGTLVQIPCVAQEWIPFVLGALDQLRLPSTWAVADDDAMLTVLQRAEQLRGIIASWGACEVLSFDCLEGVPRYSVDGGETWTALPDCFTGPPGETGATGPQGIPGPVPPPIPPNIPGSSTTDEACNIASYLAALIIKASVQQQVDAINASAHVLDAALGLVALIPGLGLVIDIGLAAAFALNTYIALAGTGVFTTALASVPLWSEVQCAIYLAIKDVGYTDATNYADVEAALAALTYSNADVVSAIAGYWTALTLMGVQAAQVAGSLYEGDCSACEFTPGCATMIATTVGTGASYDDTPLGGGTVTHTGTDVLYSGVIGSAPNYAHPFWIKAHLSGTWGAVGWTDTPLTHGGPNAGDNLWVNSVSVYGVLNSSGTWVIVSNGSVLAGGTVAVGAGNSQMQFFPGGGGVSMQFSVNGTTLWTGAFPDDPYYPIAMVLFAGDVLTNVQVCQEE